MLNENVSLMDNEADFNSNLEVLNFKVKECDAIIQRLYVEYTNAHIASKISNFAPTTDSDTEFKDRVLALLSKFEESGKQALTTMEDMKKGILNVRTSVLEARSITQKTLHEIVVGMGNTVPMQK